MCNCIVGIYYNIDSQDLVTLDELKQFIEETKEFNKKLLDDPVWSQVTWMKRKEYTLSDLIDKRKSTPFSRFNFCPYCGKKINWKKIKKEECNYENLCKSK